MNNMVFFLALAAAIPCSIWPIILNQSRLKGILAIALMSAMQTLLLFCISFFTESRSQIPANVAWKSVVIAGILSTTGIALLVTMVGMVPVRKIGGPMAVFYVGAIATNAIIEFSAQPEGMTITRWFCFGLVALGVAGLCRG